jgi:hypothetical protein
MSSGPEFEKFAEEALTSWADDYGYAELEAGIEALLRARFAFPPAWPAHRCEAFITEQAYGAAVELGEVFDDVIDTVVDGYGRDYGCLPHCEDAAALITAARRAALDEFELRMRYDLPDDIAEASVADPGRGGSSMSACGAVPRPPTVFGGRRAQRARRGP